MVGGSTPGGSDRALFISWVPHHGRSAELARAMGAEAVWIARGTPRRKRSAPLRWALQAVETVRVVRRERPSVVFVMCPPALAVVCARLAALRATVVADAHGKAVRRIGSDRVRWSFRVVARMADLVLVASDGDADRVRSRCRSVVVVSDPLGEPRNRPGPRSTEPVVVFPAGWEADEPLDALVAAAAGLPDVGWVVTGEPRRSLPHLPSNVTLSGRLPDDEYFALLSSATLVLALTDRSDTMQRAGYDAALVGVGLVASDTDALRRYFEDAAVYCGNEPDRIAAAVSEGLGAAAPLAERMRALADRRRAEQQVVLDELRKRIDAITRAGGSAG